DEAVEVGHLADAGVLHSVVHAAHRREDGVHGDDANGQAVGGTGRLVATALLYRELHRQTRVRGVEGREVQVRVDDFVVGSLLNLAGGDFAGAGRFQVHLAGAVRQAADADVFDVEQELHHVFLHVGDSGELVLYAFDAYGRDGGAGQGAEQRPAQGVTDCDAEAGTQGLRYDPAEGLVCFVLNV